MQICVIVVNISNVTTPHSFTMSQNKLIHKYRRPRGQGLSLHHQAYFVLMRKNSSTDSKICEYEKNTGALGVRVYSRGMKLLPAAERSRKHRYENFGIQEYNSRSIRLFIDFA